MKHARLSTSDRLKRTLRALKGAPSGLSTRELGEKANIVAVSAAVAELRANGATIHCFQITKEGRKCWIYVLKSKPKE